jgi:allantoinase
MIPIIDRPPLKWPGGKRMAVYIGLNVEYYQPGKPSVGILEKAMNRIPDPLNEGWRDYGPRVGVWRMMDLFDRYDIRPSVLLNADACSAYPRIIEEGCKRGWSWIAHGKNNSMFVGSDAPSMTPDEERQYLQALLSTIHRSTGIWPQGWLGPLGLSETNCTIDLLATEGLTYTLDWINDDQPYPLRTGKTPIISLPYSLEINDLPLFLKRGICGPEFEQMVIDQFEVLYQEVTARVMAIGLHPFVMGQPFRHKYLERIIQYLSRRGDIWLTTSDEIAKWYLSEACSAHREKMATPQKLL